MPCFCPHLPPRLRKALCLLAAAGTLAALPGMARAEGWDVKASLAQRGEYDSNPLMQMDGGRFIYGSITTPGIMLGKATETSHANLGLSLDQNVFNRSDFNSTDILATADLASSTPRWTGTLKAQINRDTSRTSDQTTYGAVAGSTEHTGLSLAPGIAWKTSETDTVGVDGGFYMSRYADGPFTDYTTLSVTPHYDHALTELTSALVRLNIRRYQTTSGDEIHVNSFGPSAGFRTAFTPRLTLQALTGMQASRRDENGNDARPWTFHYTYAGSLQFKGEQDTTSFTASREQQSYGNATDTTTTSVALSNAHALNELVSLTTLVRYESLARQDNAPGSLDSRLTTQAGLTYRLTDAWAVQAQYSYRRDTLLDIDGVIQGHVATAGIAYSPSALSLW